ncbi:MAG TPA: carboxylating nicotinate-nucleotide diphosphorylase [Solirubrobacteraceae bacterium]|nr:carboxylating nicotinate-nucleotide diphosphorylase [Solirubrobacteraceae bacterium]
MDQAELDALIRRALAEDIGPGDITTVATVAPGRRAIARISQKAPGVVFGLDVAGEVFRAVDGDVILAQTGPEGVWRENGPVIEVTGSAAGLLAAERTALNFLQQLSGVATLTARCVRAVAGTRARILDTRKTVPGLRRLQKQAVLAGGGVNHRIGLFDAILIKENHAAMGGGVGEAVRRAHRHAPQLPLEVECGTLAEVDEALEAGAAVGITPRLLLDNMSPEELRAAVERVGGRAELEASGGFTLETIRDVAETGVDFISVGALTHSAPALDLSLLLEPLP